MTTSLNHALEKPHALQAQKSENIIMLAIIMKIEWDYKMDDKNHKLH